MLTQNDQNNLPATEQLHPEIIKRGCRVSSWRTVKNALSAGQKKTGSPA